MSLPAATELRLLVAEIRDDLAAIDRLAQRLEEVRQRLPAASEPSPIDVMAQAHRGRRGAQRASAPWPMASRTAPSTSTYAPRRP